MNNVLYLIPSILAQDAINTIPAYVLAAVKDCQVLFVEDERTARRFLKKISKEIVIDSFEWYTLSKHENETATMVQAFNEKIKQEKNIGVISEAGCPGIADPGQQLVAIAHQLNIRVKPLVGPSSILLALMASGLNGQQFQFVGYLPIDETSRAKALKELELESRKKNCTMVFIETPYRNNQLMATVTKACSGSTLLCIAADLTSINEMISTKRIIEWKKKLPDLNKQPVIYCLLA